MKKDMHKNAVRNSFLAVSGFALIAGSLLALNNINKAKNEKEPQAKEIVANKEYVYKHNLDSLKNHYDGEKIGLYNEFRSAVEDINKSRASTAAKNAAIAKAANKYISDHDSVHTDFINKVVESNQKSR